MSDDIIEFDVNICQTFSSDTFIVSTLSVENNIKSYWTDTLFLKTRKEVGVEL